MITVLLSSPLTTAAASPALSAEPGTGRLFIVNDYPWLGPDGTTGGAWGANLGIEGTVVAEGERYQLVSGAGRVEGHPTGSSPTDLESGEIDFAFLDDSDGPLYDPVTGEEVGSFSFCAGTSTAGWWVSCGASSIGTYRVIEGVGDPWNDLIVTRWELTFTVDAEVCLFDPSPGACFNTPVTFSWQGLKDSWYMTYGIDGAYTQTEGPAPWDPSGLLEEATGTRGLAALSLSSYSYLGNDYWGGDIYLEGTLLMGDNRSAPGHGVIEPYSSGSLASPTGPVDSFSMYWYDDLGQELSADGTGSFSRTSLPTGHFVFEMKLSGAGIYCPTDDDCQPESITITVKAITESDCTSYCNFEGRYSQE